MRSHRTYVLQAYDPKWKERFLEVAQKLRLILGDNVVEIDHIGSTSIEGMLAKPQIDILVVLRNLKQVETYKIPLIDAGFILLGFGYVTEDDYTLAQDAEDGSRGVTAHIMEEGNEKILRYKIFRDYLRSNEEERNLYAAAKEKSYSLNKDNYGGYYDGKKEVIDEIMIRALKWASN